MSVDLPNGYSKLSSIPTEKIPPKEGLKSFVSPIGKLVGTDGISKEATSSDINAPLTTQVHAYASIKLQDLNNEKGLIKLDKQEREKSVSKLVGEETAKHEVLMHMVVSESTAGVNLDDKHIISWDQGSLDSNNMPMPADLKRIKKKYHGLCGLISFQVMHDDLLNKGSPEGNFLKDHITIASLSRDEIKNSHILETQTLISKLFAAIFKKYPKEFNLLTPAEQENLVKKRPSLVTKVVEHTQDGTKINEEVLSKVLRKFAYATSLGSMIQKGSMDVACLGDLSIPGTNRKITINRSSAGFQIVEVDSDAKKNIDLRLKLGEEPFYTVLEEYKSITQTISNLSFQQLVSEIGKKIIQSTRESIATPKKSLYEIDDNILNQGLDRVEIGKYILLGIVQVIKGFPMGHLLAIKKVEQDSFSFFDPNRGEVRGLSKEEISNKIDGEIQFWKTSRVVLVDGEKYVDFLGAKKSKEPGPISFTCCTSWMNCRKEKLIHFYL